MQNAQTIAALEAWARQELKDILSVYTDYAYDPEGGFYGAVQRSLAPVKDANRGLVLNARLLWSFASAYRVAGGEEYLAMARHALKYLQKYFIDRQYGGAYWSVSSEGRPVDETKYPYGMSFIVYGGAELCRAAGDKEALALAKAMYEVLEEHALDKVNGGYFETYTRDWKRRNDSFNIKDTSLGSKALNTHLHMIESYTNLMRVDDDPAVRQKVGGLIDIMTTKLLDTEYFHYKPYMTDNWGTTDSLFSFGHDIEGAWLLTEAVEAYGDEELIEKCKPIAIRIAASCENGLDPATGGMFAEGDKDGLVDAHMNWWVQSEAVVGFFNAYQLTGEKRYLDLTMQVVSYIKDRVVDREGGVYREWLSRSDLPAHDPANELRVNPWKTPYHNGRMCMELIERIEKMKA